MSRHFTCYLFRTCGVRGIYWLLRRVNIHYQRIYPTPKQHTAARPHNLLGYRWWVVRISMMMKGRTVVCWAKEKGTDEGKDSFKTVNIFLAFIERFLLNYPKPTKAKMGIRELIAIFGILYPIFIAATSWTRLSADLNRKMVKWLLKLVKSLKKKCFPFQRLFYITKPKASSFKKSQLHKTSGKKVHKSYNPYRTRRLRLSFNLEVLKATETLAW